MTKINLGNGFERDYSKYNYYSKQRLYIPSWDEYKEILSKINDNRLLIMIRLPCELGISPYAMVNLKKINFDRDKPRSIFVEKAKSITWKDKKGRKKSRMRSRLIPINSSLYPLLKMFIDTNDSPYIIPKERGDGAMTVQNVIRVYKDNDIPWTPHRGRHFFKSQMRLVLIKKHMYDETVIRWIMGHKPRDSGELYGMDSWDLAVDYVEEVFARRF